MRQHALDFLWQVVVRYCCRYRHPAIALLWSGCHHVYINLGIRFIWMTGSAELACTTRN